MSSVIKTTSMNDLVVVVSLLTLNRYFPAGAFHVEHFFKNRKKKKQNAKIFLLFVHIFRSYILADIFL